MSDEPVLYKYTKQGPATLGAYISRNDGSERIVENARVLVIGFDKDRPLEPDIKSLESTYSKYKWPMLLLKNFDKNRLLPFLRDEQNLKKALGVKEGAQVDLLIVHVLAHGKPNGLISTHIENEDFNREDVQQILNSLKFLEDSRKIYLYGPCRGIAMEKLFRMGCQAASTSRVSSEISFYPFIQYEAAEINSTYYFSTMEGYLANSIETEGTQLVRSWCNTLTSLTRDTSLETILTDTSRIVFNSGTSSEFSQDDRKNAQTPVVHTSTCDGQLLFGKFCLDHKKLACRLDEAIPSNNIEDMPPTKKLIDYSKMKEVGWYSDENDDMTKRGPGRVYIFHDAAHANIAQSLNHCFKSHYPHLILESLLVSEDCSIVDELETIAEILDLEYMLHVFFLTKITFEEKVISLPCFGVDDVDILIKSFTVAKCPFMCGKPKVFYFLDNLERTDFTINKKKVLANSGHNHSDVLCFIAKHQDVVEKLISELESKSTELIEKNSHLLEVLTSLVNSFEIDPSDCPPLIISTLLNRVSFIKVESPYIEPNFIEIDKSQKVTYDKIQTGILKTVRLQDKKMAYVVCAEAGTGKTRFADEVFKYLKANRVVTIHIKAKEHERMFAYKKPFQEIVKELNKGKEVVPEKAALILDAIDEICPHKREEILHFLKDVAENFLFVMATSRTHEEQHVYNTLMNFNIIPHLALSYYQRGLVSEGQVGRLKFDQLSGDEVEKFMASMLRDVAGGMDYWTGIKKEIKLVWTPQLLKLLAEYIRSQVKNSQRTRTLGINNITKKFDIYWKIFNQRLKESKNTLPNRDQLDVIIAHLKAAIFHKLESKSLILSKDDRSMVERVGFAYFRSTEGNEQFFFTHQSWSEFLVSLALISPKGMLDEDTFSLEEKASFLTNPSSEVLEFLNQSIDFQKKTGVFDAKNFLSEVNLVDHLTNKGYAIEMSKIVCKQNLYNLYIKYVVEKLPEVFEGEGITQMLHASSTTTDLSNRNGGKEPGDITLDLISRGADIIKLHGSLKGKDERDELIKALARSNNWRVLESLDKAAFAKEINLAILEAVKYDQIKSVKSLEEKGANMSECGPFGNLLHHAAYHGSQRVFEYLLKKTGMKNINLRSNLDGKTPLHLAVWGGKTKMVQWMLEYSRTDVNAIDNRNCNVFHQAVLGGDEKMIKLLLGSRRLREKVKEDAKDGDTPLHLCFSSWREKKEVVDLLLQNGVAKADTQNKKGVSPLHLAALKGHVDVVKQLLEENRVQIDARTEKGRTALHLAAGNGHDKVVDLLLQAKADVNAVDNDRNTALHKAANYGHRRVVERLLREDSLNVDALNTKGETALHRATLRRPYQFMEEQRAEVAEMLTQCRPPPAKRMRRLPRQ